METSTKPIKLSEINYPVYRIGSDAPSFLDSIALYIRQYDKDNTIQTTYSVIDDKSIEAPSLGKRRLILLNNNIKLKKLSKAVFFLGDLIKIAKPGIWFVDSNGTIFKYKKQNRYKLVSKLIIKVIKIRTGGVVLELKDSIFRHKALYGPTKEQKYALVLENITEEILYGFNDNPIKTSWRMV